MTITPYALGTAYQAKQGDTIAINETREKAIRDLLTYLLSK